MKMRLQVQAEAARSCSGAGTPAGRRRPRRPRGSSGAGRRSGSARAGSLRAAARRSRRVRRAGRQPAVPDPAQPQRLPEELERPPPLPRPQLAHAALRDRAALLEPAQLGRGEPGRALRERLPRQHLRDGAVADADSAEALQPQVVGDPARPVRRVRDRVGRRSRPRPRARAGAGRVGPAWPRPQPHLPVALVATPQLVDPGAGETEAAGSLGDAVLGGVVEDQLALTCETGNQGHGTPSVVVDRRTVTVSPDITVSAENVGRTYR